VALIRARRPYVGGVALFRARPAEQQVAAAAASSSSLGGKKFADADQ
jgi:hypothetical protein